MRHEGTDFRPENLSSQTSSGVVTCGDMTRVLSRLPDLSRTFAVLLLGFGAGVSVVRGQDSESLLPSWDEEATKIGDDALAPPAGLLPDPGPEGEPSQLPPAEGLPELPPLSTPTDGEEAPELPDIPGLVAPKSVPMPLNKAGQPAVPDPLANLTEAPTWYRSPREARAAALQKGRPMLLVFAGFDWSPACQALNNDLFANPAFKEYAAQNLVMSFLNVPTRSTLAGLGSSNDEKKDLKMRRVDAINAYRTFLKVRSLPTMILFDSEGHELERMVGYNFNKTLRPASYAKINDKITRTTTAFQKQKVERERKRKMLAENQEYRVWTSRAGTTLFAKTAGLIVLPAPTETEPEATEWGVVLMDEDGARKSLPLRLLRLADAELVRRKYTAKSSDPPGFHQGLPIRTPDADSTGVEVAPGVANKSQ